MSKRFKLSKGRSKRMFSNNAGSHGKNMPRPGAGRNPMRGGIRL